MFSSFAAIGSSQPLCRLGKRMEIAIRNYLAGSYLLESSPQNWDAIVILDSELCESEFINEYTRNHLFLRFDDVVTPATGKRPPTVDQIESAMNFASDSDRLLVCCRAGQSRSAATAFSIAYDKLGVDTAIGLLNPKRHAPNTLIIDLAANIIDDPMFATTFHDWQNANLHIRLTDYVEEVANEMDVLESNGARNRIVHS